MTDATLGGAAPKLPPSHAGKTRRNAAPAYNPALVGANPPNLANLKAIQSNTVSFESLITGPKQIAGKEARTTFDNLLSRSNQIFAVTYNGRIYVAPNKWAASDWNRILNDHLLDAYDAHREDMNAGVAFARAKKEAVGIKMDAKTEAMARAAWHTLCAARGRKAKIVFDVLYLGEMGAPAGVPDAPPVVATTSMTGLAARIVRECLPHLSEDERLALVTMLGVGSTEGRGISL
jgi:hypothetical protein